MTLSIEQLSKDSVDEQLSTEIKNSRIAVVEDNDIDFEIIKHALNVGFEVIRYADAETALANLFELNADLILLDYWLPKMTGLELCKQLKQHSRFETIPIVMLTGESYLSMEGEFWEAGCNDFIAKPFNVKTLIHRITKELKYKALIEEYKDAAMVDSLTKVFNRRYLEAVMRQFQDRNDIPDLSVLLIDVDWFKKYNDLYGHLAGDVALLTVATCLKSSLSREADFVSRFGGEEFAVILPHTQAKGCELIANRITSSLEKLDIEHSASPFKRLTVSIGGVTYEQPPKNWKQMFESADMNLYKAKETGRNTKVLTAQTGAIA